MAVDDQLPIQAPLSATSTLSSSSSSRRQLVHVATNNSSTFIQFPNTSRQLSSIPTDRSRTSRSITRPITCGADVRSVSNTHLSSIPTTDRNQQRLNPILNNSLLNYRKEQPKCTPIKVSTDYSVTTRLCLSSKPVTTDPQLSIIHTINTPPPTEDPISDQPNENEDNEQEETQPMDKSKYDFITRWLQEVEQAKSSKGTLSKTKRRKTKCI